MSDTAKFSTDLVISGPKHRKRPNGLASIDFVSSASFSIPGINASIGDFGAGFDVALNFANIDPDGPGDDLGLFKIDFTYFFPKRMAAEIDLPPVTGGGYLEKTATDLRGAFNANLGVIDVNAMAVIETDRFSLLALMAAEFQPPLQLSFGFTLVGVGGIVGINRRADEETLTDAMRNGDLSQLLFPRDPVGEAPHLLDVANRCFPYQPGGMLVGPMFKLGWGTPTMLSATLAIIMSTADTKAILLGRLAVTLPAEAAPLIYLQALIKGDIDQWGVRIDATLNNSRIIFMPIDGDISLRMITGPVEPLFALSAGGFYPGFAPPQGMGPMRRLSIDLSPNPLMRLRAEAYLAITTNSTQFGARVEMQLGVDGYGIHGYLQVDAFLNTDPFRFEVGFQASVSVECADFDVASIRLSGVIGGPARWHLSGRATVDILLFEDDIDLPRIEWGSGDEPKIFGRDPLAVLEQAIVEPDNWTAINPENSKIVRLRNGPGDKMVCHPLGSVAFRQSNIPLETEIQLVDGVSLESPVSLSIGEGPFLMEKFIPDRFFKLDDNHRLSKSGYRELPGGFDFSPPAVSLGRESQCSNAYEIKVLHKEEPFPLFLVRPDFQGVLSKPDMRVHQVQVKPPFTPRDPGLAVRNPAAGFTDAVGRTLAEIPQWELGVQ
ncbi:UNVERIFIED_ORG: hypothetical protein GGI66_006207 [Rhizobium esperanzae]